MSKIINFGVENKKTVTSESRLEFTLKMLNKLIENGVFTKESEMQLIKMRDDTKTILDCPDKSIRKSWVVACDNSRGKAKIPEYKHITLLGDFGHENEEMQKLFELEKMVLWELHGNLNGKKCTVKDLNGNILKNGVIELLFSENEDSEYGIRILLDGEILRDIAFNEFFYVTTDYKSFEIEVLNGDNHFQIEVDGIITDRDTALYSECFLKRMKMMREYMTPEQNEEFDNMAISCFSDIVESDTGVKPEIEKEGGFIKVTVEEPIIN